LKRFLGTDDGLEIKVCINYTSSYLVLLLMFTACHSLCNNSNTKMCGAQDCVDFRTMSLVSHASKVALKILSCRLEAKARVISWERYYIWF